LKQTLLKDFDLLDAHTTFFSIRNVKRIDPIMALLALALAAVGLAVLYSASRSTSVAPAFNLNVQDWPYYQKQGLFLLAGIGLALGIMCLDSRFLISLGPVMYAVTVVLLLAVILFGTSAKGGQRWLPVGPFRLQPSEQTKIVVVYMLAWYLSIVKERIRKFPYLILAFAIVGLPAVLILKQPSLGTAMTLIPLAFVMAYAAGCKGWHLVLLVLAGILITPKTYDHLEPYQQARLLSFVYPSDNKSAGPEKTAAETPWQVKALEKVGIEVPKADPQGIGWQTRQSKITVGSGGFYGKGFTKGTQTMLNYLPEHHTDFIFSLLAEEKGFIGAAAVICLFAVFLLRGLQFAKDCQDMAGTLLGVGAVTILAFHVFVNIAITIGIMPVTGIPLPFLSYGGNFYLTTMMAVGMLLNIPVRKQLFD
jgi:rod shape determining protein RodA